MLVLPIPLIWATGRFLRMTWRIFVKAYRQEAFRGLLYTTVFLIVVGTIFYSRVEGWRLADATYFTVITLTTIGYGDLAPETTLGRLFTVIYVIIGLGVIASFIGFIAQTTLDVNREMRTPFPLTSRNLNQQGEQSDDGT